MSSLLTGKSIPPARAARKQEVWVEVSVWIHACVGMLLWCLLPTHGPGRLTSLGAGAGRCHWPPRGSAHVERSAREERTMLCVGLCGLAPGHPGWSCDRPCQVLVLSAGGRAKSPVRHHSERPPPLGGSGHIGPLFLLKRATSCSDRKRCVFQMGFRPQELSQHHQYRNLGTPPPTQVPVLADAG